LTAVQRGFVGEEAVFVGERAGIEFEIWKFGVCQAKPHSPVVKLGVNPVRISSESIE
jgi:hypothetical protein